MEAISMFQSSLSAQEITMDSMVKYFMSGGRGDRQPLPVTVLTGAGVSTDSGLPDFRSREGLWTGTGLDELLTARGSVLHFDEFTAFCKLAIREVEKHKPNITHKVLAELQKAGFIGTIITQNVDGYHQEAGATNVIEAHGNIRKISCIQCGLEASTAAYLMDGGEICIRCGGKRRPGIILFGEALPLEALRSSIEVLARTKLLVAMGTTLAVAPISHAPVIVKENGGKIAVIGHESSEFEGLADYVVEGSISEAAEHLYNYTGKYSKRRDIMPSLLDLLKS